MVSILQLKRPCPCGSGKPYGECCAGGRSKRRRRRRKKKSGREKRRRRSEEPVGRGKLADVDFDAVDRFINTFATAFNEAVTFRTDEFGQNYADGEAFTALETLPTGEANSERYFLVESYYQMRAQDSSRSGEDSAAIWQQMRGHVQNNVGRAESMHAKMADARLGVWRVSRASGGLRYEPMDGSEDRPGGPLGVFCDHKWAPLQAPGVYVGWLADLGGVPGLFFAMRADEDYVSRFNVPVEQGFWGQTEEDFRSLDYEEDVLTLLVDPWSVEAALDSGRYFLSSYLQEDGAEWYAGETRDNFVEDVYAGRLRLGDHAGARERTKWCESCGEYHFYREVLDDAWTVEVARASQHEPERLLERLQDIRRGSLPQSLLYRGPFGRHTATFLLPDETMYELVYLEEDGTVDDSRVAGAERFRVEALPLEPAEIRELGLSEDWTIGHACAWMREQGDSSAAERLEDACERFTLALRWVSIMAEHARIRDEFPDEYPGDVGAEIADDEWFIGIRELIPSAMNKPLDEFDDPGRGTWARIEKAMREQTAFDGSVVRLSNLPRPVLGLTALDGIGQGTANNLGDAVRAFVVDWPMSAGHHPATKLDVADSSEDLQSGLDELDELF